MEEIQREEEREREQIRIKQRGAVKVLELDSRTKDHVLRRAK